MELRQHSQIEQIEKAKIERRRREHAERLKRIMDERNLQMGMDYDALQKQIDEKKARLQAEKEEEEAYNQKFLAEQKLLAKLAKNEQAELRQIQQEINEFRATRQRPEMEREYDLNRKDYIKVQPPMRVTDNDPWLSVSSGLKFDGEDLSAEERWKAQKEQRERWGRQQIAEKKNRLAKEREEDKEWERRYLEYTAVSQAVGEAEDQARKEWRQECNEENLRLAAEKRAREAEERRKDLEYNQYEITSTIDRLNKSQNNDGLDGDGNSAAFVEGKRGQMDTQLYKGMTPQEIERLKQIQLQQIEENRRRREMEAEQERIDEENRKKAARDALKMSRAEERERKRRQLEMIEENMRLAKSKTMTRSVDDILDGDKNNWWPFGKSHR